MITSCLVIFWLKLLESFFFPIPARPVPMPGEWSIALASSVASSEKGCEQAISEVEILNTDSRCYICVCNNTVNLRRTGPWEVLARTRQGSDVVGKCAKPMRQD